MGFHSKTGDGVGHATAMYSPVESLDEFVNRDSIAGLPKVPLGKVVFDKVFALCALLFFAPVLLAIWFLLMMMNGTPTVFAHDRVGYGGRTFRCYKFRTMFKDADVRLESLLMSDPVARAEWESCRKLTNDPRVSRLGMILRKTSLDELPQFWNVLKGDMSIVGPRPIVEDERRYYGAHFAEYISVRPGITGPWQVGGRSNTSYGERVAKDVEYVHTRSFIGDLKIIWRTIYVILVQDGAR